MARRRERRLTDALRCVRRGWRVHPLRGKLPILKGWPERATTDPSQIRKWWDKFPKANVGVATGRQSNLLVLDVDNKHGKNGEHALEALLEELGPLPDTLVVKTPHGYHRYFSYPAVDISNSVGKLGPGLDIRADGGYVVAPRSEIHDQSYTYLNEAAVGCLPQRWVDRLKARSVVLAAAAEEGFRNDTLFREACKLRARNISQSEALAQLHEFNRSQCTPPLDDQEVQKCVQSAWRYRPGYQRNDRGNAQRFVDAADGRVRFVPELGAFIVFDGSRWSVDTYKLLSIALMKKSNERLWREAQMASEDRREIEKYAVRSQNTAKLKSALESVESEPGVPMSIQELDADPYLLGVQNGVIELKTGRWRDTRKEDLTTRAAGCHHDPNAKCRLWKRFLRQVTNNDHDLIEHLQRLVGYTLTGLTDEQILLFLHGRGANGKSVFLETIKELLGDYSRNMRTDVLMARSRSKGGPSEDEARLVGARYVTVNETSDGTRFNEALIKDLTGGDTITARRLYENSFEFRPQFKLWIRGNHKPAFNGDDGGMARRIKLIPFTVRIPDSRRDPALARKLRHELPGILNWAIEGCLNWQRGGLQEPDVVLHSTAEYVSEMDTFARFLEECCEIDSDYRATAGQLHRSYRYWCHQNSLAPASVGRIAQALSDHGFRKERRRIGGSPARLWRGLSVRKDAIPPTNWK